MDLDFQGCFKMDLDFQACFEIDLDFQDCFEMDWIFRIVLEGKNQSLINEGIWYINTRDINILMVIPILYNKIPPAGCNLVSNSLSPANSC